MPPKIPRSSTPSLAQGITIPTWSEARRIGMLWAALSIGWDDERYESPRRRRQAWQYIILSAVRVALKRARAAPSGKALQSHLASILERSSLARRKAIAGPAMRNAKASIQAMPDIAAPANSEVGRKLRSISCRPASRGTARKVQFARSIGLGCPSTIACQPG